MKAARIHEFGHSDRIRIEDVEMPRLGRGQALVRVCAASVNPVDWMIRERIYNPEGANRVPLTLGQDFSGVLEKLGPDTNDDFHEGDEVLGEAWGTFAEYVAVPVDDLVHKPKALDFVTAASIPMAGLTAWQAVIDTGGARPGVRFLIHGASGGVGSFAAQFARWRHAEVIVTSSRESFDYLESIGMTQRIDYHEERFEDRVRDIDVVIDPVGGETQERSWSVIKRGGMLINLVGEIDQAAADRAGVQGIVFAVRYDTRELDRIAQLVTRGLIVPHITGTMPLAYARRALDLNQQGKSHGKIVLAVA